MHGRMSRRKLALFLGDALFIGASLACVALIQKAGHLRNPAASVSSDKGFLFYPFFWLVYLTSFYIFDLYNPRLKVKSLLFDGLFSAALVMVLAGAAVFLFAFPQGLNRKILLLHLLLTAVFVVSWRLLFSWIFRLAAPQKNVLLIGPCRSSEEFRRLIEEMGGRAIVVQEATEILDGSYILPTIHQIIFSPDSLQNPDLAKHLVSCKLKGISTVDLPSFVEGLSEKLPLHLIEEKWLLQCRGFDQWRRFLYKRLRRVMDLAAGIVILLAGLPIGLMVALAVKLTSRGPVFYSQERVGKNRQLFRLIKFRTMVKHAEEAVPRLTALRDPRITAAGKFLRLTRLDELPQALNIIRGDMSFIGPRPERPEWVSQFEKIIPLYSLRFHIKPGLTGWAQVNYRYGETVPETREKLAYDLYYIKNMNLLLDLRIILKTVRIILLGKGR
jgi:exopolysaccharide biosynthesis polyprenyl glycosylphosphotransferase